jgi:hypothetical protein
MLFDIQKAVEWTFQNIKYYGGDPYNITLMGHSAGAHLCSLLLIKNAQKRCLDSLGPNCDPYNLSDDTDDILHTIHGVVLYLDLISVSLVPTTLKIISRLRKTEVLRR